MRWFVQNVQRGHFGSLPKLCVTSRIQTLTAAMKKNEEFMPLKKSHFLPRVCVTRLC